jgi:hypothetical protein
LATTAATNCEKYSAIAHPLNKLMAKETAWQWGSEQRAAVDQLKEEMCREGKILRQSTARAAAGTAH